MFSSFAPKSVPEISAVSLNTENIAAALAVADRCFPNPQDQSFLRGHWARVLAGNATYFCPDDEAQLTLLDHFVYTQGGEVIAFGGLYRHDAQPDREWLNWFGVDPGYRGHGHGYTIIEHLAGVALRRGSSILVGYTEECEENAGTKRFYVSLQFKPTDLYLFRGEEVRLYERKLKGDT
jgi:GNAT superfamily N-acetyltransferase